MNPDVAPAPPPRPCRETAGALVLLAVFLLANLLVATRTPTVFGDEPVYCDPAANLYLGAGFTSTMWGQNRADFWCGNVPLYQGILFCCFKAIGFGLLQARLVNSLLAAAGALLIWAALRKTSLIRQPAHRLAALALMLSGSVTTLTFRTIRPDATMFFVCALAFFACTFAGQNRARLLPVALCVILFPFAGIPLIPYTGLLLLIHFAAFRFARFALLAAVAAGLAIGGLALVAFYHHFAAWQTFVQIVLPFTGVGGVHRDGAAFLHAKLLGPSLGDESILTSFFGNPFEFLDQKTLFDHSAALLFLAAVVLILRAWRSAGASQRRFMIFILAATLAIPPLMHLAGHYRSFYRWMTFIPLAIAVPALLEMQPRAPTPRLRRALFAALGLSIFMGIPLRTLLALPGWQARSINPLERVAAQVARPSDIAVGEFKTYFALRPRVRLFYACGLTARGEFTQTRDLPVDDITLLCLYPEDFEPVTRLIGGHWKKVPLDKSPDAAALAQTRYAVTFYRRDPGTAIVRARESNSPRHTAE